MDHGALGDELWRRVSSLFADDDGALHDIRIVPADGPAVVAIVDRLQALSRTSEVLAWSKAADAQIAVRDLAEAAAGVVAGHLEPVHTLMRALRMNNIVLPDLGVFVCPDEIIFDYRPGREWTPATVVGLFALLRQLVISGSNDRVALHNAVVPAWQEGFVESFQWFCSEYGSA